jgi:hypothetical protein
MVRPLYSSSTHYMMADIRSQDSGNYMYRLLQHLKEFCILLGTYFRVPYGSHNKQRLFPWTKSKSHCDWRSVNQFKSWCRASSATHDQIFITLWHLRLWFCGAPSLTRGRVCILYMLLVLASVVFLGSESLGTRDHLLLSQILDFPFRRLLRLAGSRWRYSHPPPRGLFPKQH